MVTHGEAKKAARKVDPIVDNGANKELSNERVPKRASVKKPTEGGLNGGVLSKDLSEFNRTAGTEPTMASSLNFIPSPDPAWPPSGHWSGPIVRRSWKSAKWVEIKQKDGLGKNGKLGWKKKDKQDEHTTVEVREAMKSEKAIVKTAQKKEVS
ncbi:hypothetical protein K435DRAFT_837136 [Dendrothele bispora CBS 962.96]|uniref:Uncharacterized protein n=1 Tax=Dendrothele bispora (strain CBS 962.96) TaxID=1314807 RepID=A0A4S8MDW7_DENBC|nr:hypothetical protein K435DRAFT_837136 [Dendrothele bispora CBS 962.96]